LVVGGLLLVVCLLLIGAEGLLVASTTVLPKTDIIPRTITNIYQALSVLFTPPIGVQRR